MDGMLGANSKGTKLQEAKVLLTRRKHGISCLTTIASVA